MERIIPDTSAVIIGAISEIMEKEELDFPEIIVPEAVVCELEHQANANRSEGHRGLSELQKLQKLQDEGKLAVSFKGKRPTNYDIRYAKSGEIDSIIRDLARSEMGILVTNDKVQAEVAKSIIQDAGLGVSPIVKNIGGSYTLQVGVYSTHERAQQEVNSLLKSNFPARISE